MKTIKKRGLIFLLAFFLIVGIVSSVNVNVTYAANKKTHIKKKTISLVVGKTYQQKLIDKKGKTIKPTKVKWRSLKKSVARITKKGKIKAVKKGTAKMTAKYKGKTFKFTVKVNKPNTNTTFKKIYNYVKKYGYSVDDDYAIPGNRCIESDISYGSDYYDVFIISIDTKKNSTIYFNSFRIIEEPLRYDNTKETTTLEYNINSKKGRISFLQQYYSNSSYTSWSLYLISGTITYAKYLGVSYDTEKGITNFSKKDVHVGDYESKGLVEGAKVMTKGIDKLLNKTFKLRIRNIGFTKL